MSKFRDYLRAKPDMEEQERLLLQASCSHAFWSTWCGQCKKVLASDHHINYHTGKNFKLNVTLAILITKEHTRLDTKELEKIKDIRFSFDELTVVTKTLEQQELYDSIKLVTKSTTHNLEHELDNVEKYRSNEVKRLEVYIEHTHIDFLEVEELCIKRNVILKII